MAIEIRITVEGDRISAEIPGTRHHLNEPNEVAVSHNRRGLRLEAVGSSAASASAMADRRPAYDPETFDPNLTASVMHFLQLALLNRHRSFLNAAFDSYQVRLTLPDYNEIPAHSRSIFEATLVRWRTTWWINGKPLASHKG